MDLENVAASLQHTPKPLWGTKTASGISTAAGVRADHPRHVAPALVRALSWVPWDLISGEHDVFGREQKVDYFFRAPFPYKAPPRMEG